MLTQTREAPEAAQKTEARSPRRRIVGVVTSDKAQKTITVEIGRLVRHVAYGKYLRRRTSVHAHDEDRQAKVGDRVELMECRPISKTKTWRLVRVVNRA